MASVLVVEDDLRIRTSLVQRLAERGHFVESAARALEGVERAITGVFDVVVLDLGLPDMDGAYALQMIRAVSPVPIVVATARDDEAEMIRLLDAGADDYLVKPFSADQLEARVRAVLRRRGSSDAATLEVGGLCIDLGARATTLDGVTIDLTPKEYDLLLYLAEHAGQVVSKRDILSNVWRQPYGGADKTVDVHLSWLRRKLGESAAEPRYIHTRRGVGVVLVAPGP
jgi:DNA-binding response OmpR family regulator